MEAAEKLVESLDWQAEPPAPLKQIKPCSEVGQAVSPVERLLPQATGLPHKISNILFAEKELG